MADETPCPAWEWELPEADFAKVHGMRVTIIKHGWRFISEDRSEDWVDLMNHDGTKTYRLKGWYESRPFWTLFEFKPDHAQLLGLTYQGERAAQRLEEIRAWKKARARELSELKRLKAKYANVNLEDGVDP